MPNISKIKLGEVAYDIKDGSAISYEVQTLTDTQKTQARANIGATDFDGSFDSLTGTENVVVDAGYANLKTQVGEDHTAIGNLQTQIGVLAYQNEWIGSIATVAEGDEQTALSEFVQNTVGRAARKGDEVTITDRQEIWYFNGTNWIVYMSAGGTITDATETTKGVVQIGSGLSVNSGVVSVTNPVSAEEKSAWNAKQGAITASGILKGNGSGGVSAATAGTDYVVPTSLAKINNAAQSASTSIFAPVSGGTAGQVLTSAGPNATPVWRAAASGGTNIVVSATQPTNQKAGDMWFQIV